jgi:hypothetical protein
VDLQPIIAKLKADTKDFDNKFKVSVQVIERFNKKGEVIGRTVRAAAKEMDAAAAKTDGFRLAMTRLSRDIKVAGTILNTLSHGIREAYTAAGEGAKIMAAEQFFKNAGKSIAEYRKATNGMVSDAELMKKANLADSMGIDEKTFKQLVMVAEASALKTGQSFDYMFNSIITGTARSSRLLLDNLGIIVSVGQANEKYAQKIGKTVEALSAEEKQLAFVEEVARKSSGTLDEYAEVTDKTAESYARFDASVQNLADTLKVTLAKAMSDSVADTEKTVSAMNKAFNDLEFVNPSWWQKAKSFLDDWIGAWLTALGGLGIALGKIGLEKFGVSIGADAKLKGEDQKVAAANTATEMFGEIQRAAEEYGTSVDEMVAMVQKTGTTELGAALDDTIQQFLLFNKAAGHMFGKFKVAAESPLTDIPTKGNAAGLKGRGNKVSVASRPDMMPPTREQRDAAKAMADWVEFQKKWSNVSAPMIGATQRTTEALDVLDKKARDANQAVDDMEQSLKDFDKRLQAVTEAVGQGTGQILTGEGLTRPIGDMLTAAAGGMSGAMTGLLQGAGMGSAAGPFGAALGALIGVLLDVVDKLQPVTDFLGQVVEGIGLLVQNALGEFLTILYPLGEALKVLLAAVGQLLGSALRPLVVIFGAVISVVAGILTLFSGLFVILSPVVEAFAYIFWTLTTLGGAFIGLFFNVNDAIVGMTKGIENFTYGMIEAVANINNGIVKFARNTLGLKGFGKLMSAGQFGLLDDTGDGDDETEDNTDAIRENTQAVRDLAREFRNMPQNYKAEDAIFRSQDPKRPTLRRVSWGDAVQIGQSGTNLRRPTARDRL